MKGRPTDAFTHRRFLLGARKQRWSGCAALGLAACGADSPAELLRSAQDNQARAIIGSDPQPQDAVQSSRKTARRACCWGVPRWLSATRLGRERSSARRLSMVSRSR